MNLVKLQDDLKMLPMAVLQSKAQGQDPQVPPWLATSVLNERMDAQKKAGLAQGAQGEQPSIAEQLNQKAGLMALQGQQQQQAQQQMMSQVAQAPQPAPEGVPQPEQQPQPQMMAEGGLARLPVNPRMFDYRAGGIIGFAGEGEIPPADEGSNLDAVKVQAEQAIANLRRYGLRQQQQDPEGYQKAQQAAQEAQQAVKNAMTQYQSSMEKSGMTKPAFIGQKPAPQATGSIFTPGSQSGLRPEPPKAGLPAALPKPPEGNVQIPMSPELRAAMEKDAAENGITNPQFNFQGPSGSTATLTPQAAPSPAPQPAQATAPPPGLPSALPSGFEASLRGGIKRAEDEQGTTPAQAKARYAELTPEALKEPAGLAQLARLKQQQEQYEKGKEGRPMENWMRGLAAAARGGIGGFGTSYLETAEGNRAADAAQSAYQDKVMTAVEAAQRGDATTQQKALIDMVEKGDERKAKAIANQISGAGQGYQTESSAQTAKVKDITDRRGQDLHLQAAKLTSAAADVRADKAERAQNLAELRSLATSFQALIKEPVDPLSKPAEQEAVKRNKEIYRQDYEAVLAAIAKMSGNVSLQSGKAPTASTMTPAQAAALAKYGAK